MNDKKNVQHGDDRRAEGQTDTTGAQPGMPDMDSEGRPSVSAQYHPGYGDPNPGPGITSQGHRVDDDIPAQDDEQDADHKRSSSRKDMPSNERPRDQDKDRKEPMDEQTAGDDKPEHA